MLFLQLVHQFLRLADIQIEFDNPLDGQILFGWRGKPENDFGVPDRQ